MNDTISFWTSVRCWNSYIGLLFELFREFQAFLKFSSFSKIFNCTSEAHFFSYLKARGLMKATKSMPIQSQKDISYVIEMSLKKVLLHIYEAK